MIAVNKSEFYRLKSCGHISRRNQTTSTFKVVHSLVFLVFITQFTLIGSFSTDFLKTSRSKVPKEECGCPVYRRTAFISCKGGNGSKIYFTELRSKKSRTQEKSNRASNNPRVQNAEEEKLSDLDARVLQSILDEGNADLKTEDNLKRLLQRGVYIPKESITSTEESEYSSTVLQTVERFDDKFWNAVGAKLGDVLESATIYIINGIERNTKVLAALGIYAWERAKRDAGRALPAAGSSGTKMTEMMKNVLYTLPSNSSYIDDKPKDKFILSPSKYSIGTEKTVFEKLNTPLDEIQSVAETIGYILSGKKPSSTDRGLKSVSQGLSSYSSVRQKRAYERRKETRLKQEKEGIDAKVGRAASTVTDVAWELKKEMEAEGNDAGYRSKNLRKSLQGKTGIFIAGSDTKSLSGTRKGRLALEEYEQVTKVDESPATILEYEAKESSVRIVDVEAAPTNFTIEGLSKEQARFSDSLKVCLENPSQTWLLKDVIAPLNDEGGDNECNEEALMEVITMMVFVRNEMENESKSILKDTSYSQSEIIASLKDMENTINSITSLAATGVGYNAAQLLKDQLLGQEKGDGLLASLDDIIESMKKSKNTVNVKVKEVNLGVHHPPETLLVDDNLISDDTSIFSEAKFNSENIDKTQPLNFDAAQITDSSEIFVEIVDDISVSTFVPDVIASKHSTSSSEEMKTVKTPIIIETDVEFEASNTKSHERVVLRKSTEGDNIMHANVELLSDEDDALIENAKSFGVATVDEYKDAEKKESIAVALSLRTLDVVLFVGEKTLTSGIPLVVNGCTNVVSRTNEIRREGKGKKGWETLRNLNRGRKRY